MIGFYQWQNSAKRCAVLCACAWLVACGGEPAGVVIEPIAAVTNEPAAGGHDLFARSTELSSSIASSKVMVKAAQADSLALHSAANNTWGQATLNAIYNGHVYHWAKHVLMPQVDLQVTSVNSSALVQTSELGVYTLPDIVADQSYQIQASRVLRTADMDAAISSADALAALKIAVGLNPNSDPDGSGPQRALPVSPYQLMAADINADGRVSSGDALAILKIAVGLSDAVAPHWRFVDETTPVWATHATKDAVYEGDGSSVWQALSGASAPNYVGVLVGDVNASWTSPDAVDALSATYFETLLDLNQTPLAVWLLRDARDLSAPVIELVGPASLELAHGEAFVDPGASVIDDRDASVVVSVSGAVGSDPGVYTLVYSAADLAGNVVQLTREVRVLEPLITAQRLEAEDYSRAYDLTSTNQGGAYRPDQAVDIEATQDEGGGYNVGWTDAGEWLEFDVQIDTASNYLLTARVAALETGGLVRVLVDGVDRALIAVRATGGWQTWSSQQVDVGQLEAGLHTIRLSIEKGLFNLNWLELDAGKQSVEPVSGTAPTALALSQMMGLGFNIGQVFESTDKAREFAPVKAKIDAYYALGFRTIRLPVTWSSPIGGTTLIQDMTTGAVDAQHPRLGVIKAVVDYALSLPDTVVIINAHHEEPIKTQQLWWVFETLWAEIATIFKDRDKRLIFELLNEPHDVNGAAMPATMLRSMSRLAYAQIRAIDPERVVVISGNQWASSNELALVWTDLVGMGEGLDPYVMATFHHYDPWTQFHSEDSPDKAYNFDVNTIENPMRQAQQWQTTIGANMPVFIGEWGVGWGKQWNVMDCNNVRQWYELFPQSAQNFGMPTQVWDDGGWFGVFDYASGTFKNNLAQCVTGNCEWSGTERFNSACYP